MGKKTKVGKGSKADGPPTARSSSASSENAAARANNSISIPANLLSTQPPPKLVFQRVDVLLKKYIWVLPNFLTRHECQAWIAFMEAQQPLDYVKQRGTRYMASRECYRFSRQDAAMSHRLFERLRDNTQLLQALQLPNGLGQQQGQPVTCNPNLRLYKYCEGHSFGQHIDEANAVAGVGVTRLTVLIYLSECEGGATRFQGNVAFEPQPGAILLHVHGEDLCLEHEADPVISGIKYVLRTDLVYSEE